MLADSNLAGRAQTIEPGQFFMTYIIGFADAIEILAGPDYVINPLDSLGRLRGGSGAQPARLETMMQKNDK